MADDILHAFLARLAQFAPPDEVQRTEAEFRTQVGGTAAKEKKKDPPQPPAAIKRRGSFINRWRL